MDDRIIDLGEYIRRRGERDEAASRRAFAVWGGESESSRFTLPLWRAAYLAGGSRAGLVWERRGGGDGRLEPLFVLDLATEPARTRFEVGSVADLSEVTEPPALAWLEGEDMSVFLGERGTRRWYLVVTDLDPGAGEVTGRDREDVVFLAGECAGLLFHRELGDVDPDE